MAEVGKSVSTRAFRALVWMNRSHGILIRAMLATIGFAAVLMVTARRTLAAEAAGLFWQDRIKLGAHRVKWYLCHGWSARFMGPTPLFDPTTEMDAATVNVLSSWLGQNRICDRLARLYMLARQLNESVDQTALLDEYARIATTLIPALPAPNPTVKPDKRASFTLTNAKAALTALKVLSAPWYIISGTFLGAVREGTFLSHDYDVDIGINAEDFDESAFLKTVSQAANLTLVNTSPHLHLEKTDGVWHPKSRPALYRVLHCSGISIDVFIHYLDGETRWHGSAKHRWDNGEFSLAETTIAGLTVQGPADADRYLTENYGNWRTPKMAFNCSTGTPNVSFPRNLAAVAEHMRIAILAPRTLDAEVARQILLHQGYVRDKDFTLPWR